MDKIWLFSEEEFLVLAAACEVKSIFGYAIDMEKIKRENIIYSIQGLQQRGLLEISDSIRATKEMQNIFGTIREPNTTLEIRKKSGRSCLVYLDKYAVKVSKSMRRGNTFEVMLTEVDQVWNFLVDEGWVLGGKNDFN